MQQQDCVEEKMNRAAYHEPEEDFSFDCGEINASASDSPVFPLFNRPVFSLSGKDLPVKKIFVETSHNKDDEILGPYCEWSSRKASPDQVCKKSNSTGFTKIRRIKEQLVGRSSSDGRDAFVFCAPAVKTKREVKQSVKTTPVSAHEVYLRSKAKGDERRRTYLPYRPELVGFFTNVNAGLTKNVHPY